MKNIKIYLAISLLALLTLLLAACAEIPAGASSEASSYARAAKDTTYTELNENNLVDTRAGNNSSQVALKYRGTVDAVTADTLTLSGQTFSVATTQDLTTLFTPGSAFEIQFRQNRDGTISIDQFMAADSSVEYDVEFKGLVDGVTDGTITLNGETFTVANTEALTTLFTPGEVYEIKYLLNADGTISIVAFHSEGEDDGINNYDVEFKGLVDAVTMDTITLNGETFTVANTEALTTLFTPGEVYEIKYLLNADGTISIVAFHSEGEDDGINDYDVEFKGLVDAVTTDTITLNGETFTVANTEDLTALFTPGEMYEIKYIFNADGTITIVDFHFEDGDDDMSDDSSDDDWDDSSDDDSNNNDDDHDNNDNDDNNNNDNDNNDDNNNNNNDD